MSGVRVVDADGADRRGGWNPAVDTRLATLESPIRRLLEPYRDDLADADRITLVPDAHYPFHPSTGTVTDPAVTGAIAARLDRWTDADLAVAGTSDDRMAFDRTAEYLGYESVLERFGVDLVDLADGVPRHDALQTVDGRPVALAVPERLLESTVVVVPTVRPSEDGPVAGGMRTLAALVDCDVDSALAAVAATRAIDPELAILDGTTAYGGDPVAANALFAGAAPSVDAIAASLLGRSLEEDDALRLALADDETPVPLDDPDDVDLSGLRNALSGGQLPPSDETHPAVSLAYRLYATVSGDAVPPQLEGGR